MTTRDQNRSLLGSLRAAPGLATRVAHLESELVMLRDRAAELEAANAVLHAVRDDVRSLTESVAEELNRRSAEGSTP